MSGIFDAVAKNDSAEPVQVDEFEDRAAERRRRREERRAVYADVVEDEDEDGLDVGDEELGEAWDEAEEFVSAESEVSIENKRSDSPQNVSTAPEDSRTEDFDTESKIDGVVDEVVALNRDAAEAEASELDARLPAKAVALDDDTVVSAQALDSMFSAQSAEPVAASSDLDLVNVDDLPELEAFDPEELELERAEAAAKTAADDAQSAEAPTAEADSSTEADVILPAAQPGEFVLGDALDAELVGRDSAIDLDSEVPPQRSDVEIPRPSRQGSLFKATIDESLLDEAEELVRGARRASATHLARKLRIEFTDAVQVLKALEARGVVELAEGETQGSVV